MNLRRVWRVGVGGYTFDEVHPTVCQCNTSSGGCKCGNFEEDKRKEIERRQKLAATESQEQS
jgi:hypothetical protein